MSRALAPLALGFLGFLLGATATWLFLSPGTPSPGSASDSSALPTPGSLLPALPAWSWRDSATPPILSAASASATIAAWHALRAPDGSPAAFATRADALRSLLARLPLDAFPRLLDPLGDSTLSDDDLALRQIAFSTWIESDPVSAAAWAATGRDTRQDLAQQALLAWSARDLPAAAAWACALPDESTARRLAAIVLPLLAGRDPAQAIALASSRGDAFLDKVLPALLEPLARTDPASALRTYGARLWKNGDGFHQLEEALRGWIARDPAAALAWFVTQPLPNGGRLGRQLGALVLDGPQRLAFANTLATQPGLPFRQAALGSLISAWAAKSPAEALAWLDSLPDRHLRNAILEHVAQTSYSARPQESLPLALAMPEGSRRTERLGQLLGRWAETDSSAALAWLRENSATPGVAAAADSVQTTLLATIARDEPATAIAEWQALPDGPLKAKAIAHITQAWGRTDPAAALQWSAEQSKALGAGSYQSRDLIFEWARKDGPAALAWAESIEDGSARRHAIESLAGSWQDKAPRAATADLYARIKDPALRNHFVTEHVREWLTKDRASAKTWLESHEVLTPAQAAALLAP